jgi:hypothetical protein
MDELKKVSLPIVLAILSAVFLAISFIVYLKGGNSAKWISRKMKIGGLMLSLTALLNACDPARTGALIDNDPPFTCYMIAMPIDTTNRIYVETDKDSIIALNYPEEREIKGEIRYRTGNEYSYALYNTSDSIVDKENIRPNDGVFNSDTEDFRIKLSPNLEKGDYSIRFYNTNSNDQPFWSEQYFNVKLK